MSNRKFTQNNGSRYYPRFARIICYGMCFLLCQSLALATVDATDRPNIVFFLVDDMGVMDTSVSFLTDAEGNPQRYPLNDYFRTPNMQRLADQGIRFNQFSAMSVCSPSRLSMMTGQNAARHRTTNWIAPFQNNRNPMGPPDWNWNGLRADQFSIPHLLQQAGYRTIHLGKAHFGPASTAGRDPTNLGFEINIAGSEIGHPGSHYGLKNFGKDTNRPVPDLEKYHGQDIYLTEALTLEAIAQMEQSVADQQPFFLHLSHYAVHTPFESDPRFADNYQAADKPAPAKAFASMIEGMDKSLGDVLDCLDRLGIAENTLVIFLGDNGSDAPLGKDHQVACAAPLRGRKGTHYEGGMRIPLIVGWGKPNEKIPHQQNLAIPTGAIQSQMGSVCDFLPTIADWLKLDLPRETVIDGQSLVVRLSGKRESNLNESFLMHFPHDHRSKYFSSLRLQNWKIVYHYFPELSNVGQHYELFDLAHDPWEQNNLAATEPEKLSLMMGALIDSLEHHQALYPINADGEPQHPIKPIDVKE